MYLLAVLLVLAAAWLGLELGLCTQARDHAGRRLADRGIKKEGGQISTSWPPSEVFQGDSISREL